MASSTDPGALLARSFTLPRGPRVRLRLARARDRAAIEALGLREGAPVAQLDLARLLSADPRRQLAITATALIDSSETVVGFGAIDLERPGALPAALLVDRAVTGGLDTLLGEALIGRAQALHRTRAA